jgi:hypothetical protein
MGNAFAASAYYVVGLDLWEKVFLIGVLIVIVLVLRMFFRRRGF